MNYGEYYVCILTSNNPFRKSIFTVILRSAATKNLERIDFKEILRATGAQDDVIGGHSIS